MLYRRSGLFYLIESLCWLIALPVRRAVVGAQYGNFAPLRHLVAGAVFLLAFILGDHPHLVLRGLGRTLHLEPLFALSRYQTAVSITFWAVVATSFFSLLADPQLDRLRGFLNALCRYPEKLLDRFPRTRSMLAAVPDVLLAVRRETGSLGQRWTFAVLSGCMFLVFAAWVEQLLVPTQHDIVLQPSSLFRLGDILTSPFTGTALHLHGRTAPFPLHVVLSVTAGIIVLVVLLRATMVSGRFWERPIAPTAAPAPKAGEEFRPPRYGVTRSIPDLAPRTLQLD